MVRWGPVFLLDVEHEAVDGVLLNLRERRGVVSPEKPGGGEDEDGTHAQ